MIFSISRSIGAFRKNAGGVRAAFKYFFATVRNAGIGETSRRVVRFVHRYGHQGERTASRRTTSRKTGDLRSWQEEVLSQTSKAHAPSQDLVQADRLDDIGVIAFYLPQYHPFPENDAWWGTGFTEWRNVAGALPQFVGHYQPRIPADLGFYDLRTPGVLAAQAEMASQAGLAGFCFYYYWFAGKPLMDTPIQKWAESSEIDFPFCLCWANENWTRRWDGLEHEVLIAQCHSPEDDIAFIAHIALYMKDRRYIRVNGRPLLLVYRAGLLPDASATAARWRSWWRDMQGEEIYIASVHAHGNAADKYHEAPTKYGFDASVEFPPVGILAKEIEIADKACSVSFAGRVYDYEHMVEQGKASVPEAYVKFRGVMPSWDNTARRKANGFIFQGSRPDLYRNWLHEALTFTRWFPQGTDRNLVFINAWNEWAEGAYLEPDLRYGYAYLNATARALSSWKAIATVCLQDAVSSSTVACILHLHYCDLAEEFREALSVLSCDLWITITDRAHFGHVSDVFPGARIFLVSNRGRDIAPFLAIAPMVVAQGYQLSLKLHSKRSLHRVDGDIWRKNLVNGLLPRRIDAELMIKTMNRHMDIGVIAPEGHCFRLAAWRGNNDALLTRLARLSGISVKPEEVFIAGSMYWFRPSALASLLALPIQTGDFEFEDAQVDGTLAHAIERFTGACLRHSGFRMVDMDELWRLANAPLVRE